MKIGIVGCGLIGGSIGLACRSNGHTVAGVENDPKSAKIALERGCIDVHLQLPEIADSAFIFVATPPGEVIGVLEKLVAIVPQSTAVCDCASVKSEIVDWLNGAKHPNVIPGHPMAGHEKSGPQFASGWMFRGAKWILSPAKFTDRAALKSVEDLVKELGATPVRVDADRHDREVALLSHLPHVLAAALVRLAADLQSTEASAGSWKDLTRVGGADPNLWTEILLANRGQVARVLADLQTDLSHLASALDKRDEGSVRRYLLEAKAAKEAKS